MSDNKTQAVADLICQDKMYVDNLTYVSEIQRFLLYSEVEKYHKLFSDEDMLQFAYDFTKKRLTKSFNQSWVKDLIFHIRMGCYQKKKKMPTRYIAFNDKDFDTEKLEFVEQSKDHYAYHKIPFDSKDVDMETPVFDKFIKDICVTPSMEPDEEMERVMMEFYGYYLLSGKITGEALFTIGSGGNGKSQMVDLVKAMVGEDYTSAMSIQSLTVGRFKTQELIGKKLNICSEEESKFMKASMFKQLLTGDTIDVEKKFGDSFSFKPTCKFLFACNKMPSFDSVGPAMKRRIKVLKFHRVIKQEDQDKDILSKMEAELAGVIGKSIVGGKRYVGNNYTFSKCKNMDNAFRELEEVISSAVHFFREEYEESEGGYISNIELYAHYQDWCRSVGRTGVLGERNFSKDLKMILKLPRQSKYSKEKKKNLWGQQVKIKAYANVQQGTAQGVDQPIEEGDIDVSDIPM